MLEKTLESPLDCKEIQPVHPKGNHPEYSFEGLMLKMKLQYLATWCKELTHWKSPWCWERLKAGGEGNNRGWDGWVVSSTPWTWDWVSSRSWCWTGKPGVLQSMGLQRVAHDWLTDWTELIALNRKKIRIQNYFSSMILIWFLKDIHRYSQLKVRREVRETKQKMLVVVPYEM